MEPLNDSILSHAAYLARIRIDSEQDHKIISEIKAFFTWVSVIENIEMGHMETKDISFLLPPSPPDERRSDHPSEPVKQDVLLAHAPVRMAGYFVVPR